MKKFWQDFKKFITRGNVIDMAVGVAVATAFTAIVTAFTKGFISTPYTSIHTRRRKTINMYLYYHIAVGNVKRITAIYFILFFNCYNLFSR